MSIRQVNHGNAVHWTDVIKPTDEDQKQLTAEYDLHEADVKDAFRTTFRSQMVVREQYTFIVLVIPVFERESKTIRIDEIDFFIGKNWVVTIHQDTMPTIRELRDEVKGDEAAAEKLLGESCAPLIARILHNVVDRTYPMIDHIDQELEELKNQIFHETQNSRKLVKEILRIRQNITDMRKAARGHGNIFQHLIDDATSSSKKSIFPNAVLLDGLVNDAADIWEALDSNKEEVESLQDANEALIGHNSNQIFKTLTGISTLLLPAAVLAGVFGMNAKYAPFIGRPNDFWIITSIMAATTLVLFFYFVNKHWLK